MNDPNYLKNSLSDSTESPVVDVEPEKTGKNQKNSF